jgi:hypothetical protein
MHFEAVHCAISQWALLLQAQWALLLQAHRHLPFAMTSAQNTLQQGIAAFALN